MTNDTDGSVTWTGQFTGLPENGLYLVDSGKTPAFVSMGRAWLTVTKDYRCATIDLTLCDYRIEGDQLVITLKT